MVIVVKSKDYGDKVKRKILKTTRKKNANILLCKNLTALSIFGLWPFQSRNFLRNKILRQIHYVFGLVLYFLFFIFLITEYIELVHVWGNLEDMTTNMSVSLPYTLGIVKIYAFFGHRKKLKTLISGVYKVEDNILKFQSKEIKQILYDYVARARRVTYSFWILTVCTMAIFFMIPLVEYRFSSTYHTVFDNGSEYWSYKRPMIFSSWFPFDKYEYGNYMVAYVYQMTMGCIGAGYQAVWDTLIISMMIHSIGQLQILERTMAEITIDHWSKEPTVSKWSNLDCLYVKSQLDGNGLTKVELVEYLLYCEAIDKKRYDRLVHCVNHHRYILSYTREVNAIIGPAMMVYFLVCSCMLCTVGYQATLYGFSLRLCFMIEYIIAIMIQLLLFYWHGNEVINESDKLLFAAYGCSWYNESDHFKKSFWIMREGVRLSAQYTVGQFYTMSLPTFLAILRAAYSYFALLRQVGNDQLQDRRKS